MTAGTRVLRTTPAVCRWGPLPQRRAGPSRPGHPCRREAADFDVGLAPYPALDVVHDVDRVSVGVGYYGHAHEGPLPLVLVADLRHRDLEPVAETLDDRSQSGPLLL